MYELVVQLLDNSIYRALALFISSFIVAKLFDLILSLFISRMLGKTETDLDDKIATFLRRPVYYTILFIGFNFSLSVVTAHPQIIFVSKGIMKSVLTIFWSRALFKTFMQLVAWYSQRDKSKNNQLIDKKLLPLFDNIGKIIIFIAAVYFIFLSWDVNLTGWLASAGVLGIVFALAAKDTLSNFFSGIFIMADSPYKEGDYINLDTGERGYVKNIGIRSTRIMTRDDIEITIPNSVIANAKIINESGGPYEKERIRVDVDVAYGSDVDKVRKILLQVATGSSNVCENPSPRVRFRNFGESALKFQLLFWVELPEMRGRVTDEICTEIYKKFNSENIEIPFPQRTVHIKNSSN